MCWIYLRTMALSERRNQTVIMFVSLGCPTVVGLILGPKQHAFQSSPTALL